MAATRMLENRLAYVDYGKNGWPVVALYGEFDRARYESLAKALKPDWRVIALEQQRISN